MKSEKGVLYDCSLSIFFKWILILFFYLISCSISFAEETPKNKFSGPPHSYASAVNLAAPAVINIYTARDEGSNNYSSTPEQKYRLGSAVVMNKEGYILTNHHLILRSKRVLVILDDGRRAAAQVIGNDPETDLAVLKIDLKDLQPIQIGDSDNVQVGDVVLAIGNPFGLGQTVTQGIVSAIGRSMIGINELENYIQTDAAINPGNSGGALINTQGKLIGINTAIYTRSGGYQGVGFAIPINVALNVMNQIIEHGEVKRGWLGMEIRNMTSTIAKSLKLNQTSGVLVIRIISNSPAAKAGLKINDVITRVNNQRIQNARSFSNYVAQMSPGATVKLTVYRNNEMYNLEMKIGERPPRPIIDERR